MQWERGRQAGRSGGREEWGRKGEGKGKSAATQKADNRLSGCLSFTFLAVEDVK